MDSDKLQHSIDIIRRMADLACQMNPDGFWVGFSGGKDSLCVYHLARLAGVKFKAYYSLTTIDPPEVVRFIKSEYPDVSILRPALSFWRLCEKKKMLPRMNMRFCCAELKENGGAGSVCLLGVRRAESSKRAGRNEIEMTGRKYSDSLDNFNRSQEVQDACMARFGKKDKLIVLPILHWTDKDVWDFIHENNIKYCHLYDQGRKRIGCLYCPMASRRELVGTEREYPKYKAAFMRLIHRIRLKGYMNKYQDLTDEEIFQWYISKKTISQWYAQYKLQMKITF